MFGKEDGKSLKAKVRSILATNDDFKSKDYETESMRTVYSQEISVLVVVVGEEGFFGKLLGVGYLPLEMVGMVQLRLSFTC
ncbi:uncharacterized protein N7483_009282 [Penicillium malachiteum]|uniref:uncharacterized protein n=1 Tax=Penicillium malachiteum TaxID=1324776 RepID=UPI002548DAD4|nr:uncharacterized protein N7483_009282 [Penicillium malachiteum]KAJ5721348.1 hypothetical protein N7483_009282 [Penicillium malachiteum]